MSLVEKALRKLQAGKAVPEPQRVVPAPQPVTHAADPRPRHTRPPAIPTTPAPVPTVTFEPRNPEILRLNTEDLRSQGVLPPVHQEREIATQFRTIKRPIIRFASESMEADDPAHRTVMVASALPGDGKTFTSTNLALSLALEMDFTVLLVDADAPKPRLSHALKIEDKPGLLDVLSDPKRNVQDCILATDVPRLHVLPVGTQSERATELLASARMSEIVAQLAKLYRRGIVLFDSPPILLTNESRSLGAMLGQIVLVVRAGVTPQQAVKDAIAILGEGRRISLVLNSAELSGPAGYYYGYGYGYGQPGAHPTAEGE
jgi:exopolysaccharide/PEP-CTERM locus tyrosine autokinase